MTDQAALAALRQRDYVNYLALWLVPQECRDFALALFTLKAELRAIPDKVKEPTLGLMRIIWWRDAILEGAVKAHPVLQAMQLYLADAERKQPLAEWVETYDVPFLPEAERCERLQARLGLETLLIGKSAAAFLHKTRKSANSQTIWHILQLLRVVFRSDT